MPNALTRAALLAFTLLTGCADDSSRDPSSSSSTGPDLMACTQCPKGVEGVCPEDHVCVSILPGSGGLCVLACAETDPNPCVVDGAAVGSCEEFSPAGTWACNKDGPVCPEL